MEQDTSDDPEDPNRQARLRELADDLQREPSGKAGQLERLRRRLEDLRDRSRREDNYPGG
jgi:hypothetical protein